MTWVLHPKGLFDQKHESLFRAVVNFSAHSDERDPRKDRAHEIAHRSLTFGFGLDNKNLLPLGSFVSRSGAAVTISWLVLAICRDFCRMSNPVSTTKVPPQPVSR